jgi:glycosyltransferase involved in cell wall biosynthesis
MADICLVMIVRDESAIIRRALDSMKHIIDTFLIMDTGSKDGTPNIIRAWATENNIMGDVFHVPWVNFGHNKTQLIQGARGHHNPHISCASYYVWLDADEVWITDSANPESYILDKQYVLQKFNACPKHDIFMIPTLFGPLKYRRWNACRNNQLYRWDQPVHEIFVGEERNDSVDIDGIVLLARKEGNSSRNPDRYKNDAAMFLEYLRDHVDDPRATYYLAQTYESFDTAASIEWHKKRVAILSGYNEERYISCLHLGRLVTDESEKITHWLAGTRINPGRLECFYELLMLEYRKNNHRGVIGWGFSAPDEREPRKDWLFVEPAVYNGMFDLHFGVSLYWTQHYVEGLRVSERALTTAESKLHGRIKENIMFFKSKMPVVKPVGNVPFQELIVIENFYPNPDKVRADALSADYGVRGNFPGARSPPHLYEGIKDKFEALIGRPITYWPDGGYNGAFQWVGADKKSWIHRDLTDWSAVVFLTPNAPIDGGTKLFIHKETGISYRSTDEMENVLNADSAREGAWHCVDRVGNLYNRCVLFRGKRNHISDRYFGTCLEDGRLFQTFFFDDGYKPAAPSMKQRPADS